MTFALKPFTQEDQLLTTMESQIAPFWQQRQDGFIVGKAGRQIYQVKLTHPEHTKAVVVVNGRIESAWKYQELFFDLFNQGYDVYSFDHRGQGKSDRLIDDVQMGYVDKFEDYIEDLNSVLSHWNIEGYEHWYMLGHSMGGAIATRYLQQQPESSCKGLALSAPMFGAHVAWYLKPFAIALSAVIAKLSTKPNYAPGHQPYYPKPFATNPLSSSQARYTWFRNLYDQMPELQLGGPSAHWVYQALSASKLCIDQAKALKTPTLLIQAGSDTIVDNKAHLRFVDQRPETGFITIASAKHELLFDVDGVRNQALEAICDFFHQRQNQNH
ncbi:alpha/beta fold hydrolase [Vibrio sp. SCSIO 43136]|uniref:alpha/beta fold hydrolase n=1 Tax=Vibrio sp. SCSIO 43136 TaxID=2819101 RepID=UPI002074F174|nr:alpha/beta fold hydrolase [Vibrio sp. SCSIO 43136]USD65375.1 alpha/beta fold hydrolase [Vibrio sp. SCSIO 43136]